MAGLGIGVGRDTGGDAIGWEGLVVDGGVAMGWDGPTGGGEAIGCSGCGSGPTKSTEPQQPDQYQGSSYQ